LTQGVIVPSSGLNEQHISPYTAEFRSLMYE